jgi:hypothetical protein
VLREVEQVVQTLQSEILATPVVARLEQTDDERAAGMTRLRWSNAGHLPPMAITPDGQVQILDRGRPDRLLGVLPDAPRREAEVTLPWNSVVLLYSDGLVESRHGDIDHGWTGCAASSWAGRPRPRRAVRPGADSEAADHPGDDVALIAVQLHSQDRPPPPQAGPNRVPPDGPAV